MAYLEENEWMLLNEVVYNITFIYTVEEMQDEVLNRWLPFLIPYDAAVFARLTPDEGGTYQLTGLVGHNLPSQMLEIWRRRTQEDDSTRWIIYREQSMAFLDSSMMSEESLKSTALYREFYLPNRLKYSLGFCIAYGNEPVGFLKLYRREERGDFTRRDIFVLEQLQKHLAYRLIYERKKGDARYFFAKGYHDKMCRRYGLTEREGELLYMAVQGYSNDDISREMGISIHTVKKHFHNIYSKMNVKNRVQMLRYMPLSTSKISPEEL